MAVMNSKLNSAAFQLAEVTPELPQGYWTGLYMSGFVGLFNPSGGKSVVAKPARPFRKIERPKLPSEAVLALQCAGTPCKCGEEGNAQCKENGYDCCYSCYRIYSVQEGCKEYINCGKGDELCGLGEDVSNVNNRLVVLNG